MSFGNQQYKKLYNVSYSTVDSYRHCKELSLRVCTGMADTIVPWWCVLRLDRVHRQITFVGHDLICSLTLKISEPKLHLYVIVVVLYKSVSLCRILHLYWKSFHYRIGV